MPDLQLAPLPSRRPSTAFAKRLIRRRQARDPLRPDGQRQDGDGNPPHPGSRQRKGSRVAFVADRVTLVEQTSKRLGQYGIRHGVVQAGNTPSADMSRFRFALPRQSKGAPHWGDLDLLIIDECHTQRKAIQQFAVGWGGPVIGLSATPLTEGLGKTYQSIVNAITTDALLADEWLAPLRVFAAKEIGMKGAKKTAGEWQASEVRERGQKIIGDIVSEWVKHTQEHFGGPVPTLLFSRRRCPRGGTVPSVPDGWV